MKKVLPFLFLTTLVLTFALPAYAATPQGFSTDHEAVQEAAADSDKPIFVMVCVTGCSPCVKVGGEIIPQPQIQSALSAEFELLYVFDDDDFHATYQIGAWPTFMLIDTEGHEIARFEGFGGQLYTAPNLLLLIEKLTQRHESWLAFEAELADAADDTQRAEVLAQRINSLANDRMCSEIARAALVERLVAVDPQDTHGFADNHAFMILRQQAKDEPEAAIEGLRGFAECFPDSELHGDAHFFMAHTMFFHSSEHTRDQACVELRAYLEAWPEHIYTRSARYFLDNPTLGL